MAVGRNDNYDLKKKGTVVWQGIPQAPMFWRVHNCDLKKKYSHLAVGRNDNYILKKKVQSSGGFIITSRKKRFSHLAVSGNVLGAARQNTRK